MGKFIHVWVNLIKVYVLGLVVLMCFSSFSQRHKLWVAIGDSITYLNDHLSETGNRVTKGYMTRIKEKRPHIDFINQGHNGWTVVGIAREIEKLGLVKADVYTIFLGTNDWWGGTPIGTIEDYRNKRGLSTLFGAYRVIIDKLKALNPEAKIILVTPMQRTDFVYIANHQNNAWGSYKDKNGRLLESFANAIALISRYEKFDLVDLYNDKFLELGRLVKFKRLKDKTTGVYKNYKFPDYIDIPFNPLSDEYPFPLEAVGMTYDGLHPSDAGYARIAKVLLKHVR